MTSQVWTLFDYYGESHGWPRVSSAYGQFDLAGFQKHTARWYRAWWLSNVPESDAGRPVGFGAAHSCYPYTTGGHSALDADALAAAVDAPSGVPCANGTFKFSATGLDCDGLVSTTAGDSSAADCEQACCAVKECDIWQWAQGPGGSKGGDGCWTGKASCSISPKPDHAKWTGGARTKPGGGGHPGGGGGGGGGGVQVLTEAAKVELYEDGVKTSTAFVLPLQTATLAQTKTPRATNLTVVCLAADGTQTGVGTIIEPKEATKIELTLDAPSVLKGRYSGLAIL